MTYDASTAGILLARTPSILRPTLLGLPDPWLHASEGPDTWSPFEIACHMADLERDAWLPRARWILEHGAARPLPDVDRERFRTRYADASVESVLDDFAEARSRNLEELEDMELDATVLATTGHHPALGEVRLAQLLSTWVVHDLTHLSQIDRTLASHYRDEVGPWQAFLSVLRRPENAGA